MAGFGLLAQGMARARRTQGDVERQRRAEERQQEQDERAREMASIQQAALLAGLGEKGISRSDQGDPLGNTGFRQDPSMTNRAKELAAQRQRQEMLNRRRAVLRARGVNPDEIDVENDDIYESYAKFQQPKGPQAPTPGTPEYFAMREKEAQIAARYRQRPEPKPRVLPTSAVDKLVGLQDMRDQAQQVSQALSAAMGDGTNVTGRVAGVVRTPTWAKNLAGMGGEKGKDIRALIGGLYATVTKERAGTALSPGELNLLESYMPNENEDEATALVKANRFIRTLDKMMENKRKAYQKYGYSEGSADIVDDAQVPYPEY